MASGLLLGLAYLRRRVAQQQLDFWVLAGWEFLPGSKLRDSNVMAFSEDTDFHDAILHNVNVDYSSREVFVRLSAYENQNSKDRTKVELKFEAVNRYSVMSNLEAILDNRISGNVNYHSNEYGASCFHLIGGIIEIEAKNMTISLIP